MISYSLTIDLIQVAGVETCFKNIAKCDFHAQCDPAEGSDTAEDELNCDAEYREKRLIPKQATYRCQSPIHNEDSVRNSSLGVVWIRAALNDGNPECWNGEDEIERSTVWVKYYLPGLEPAVYNKRNFEQEQIISLHMTQSFCH